VVVEEVGEGEGNGAGRRTAGPAGAGGGSKSGFGAMVTSLSSVRPLHSSPPTVATTGGRGGEPSRDREADVGDGAGAGGGVLAVGDGHLPREALVMIEMWDSPFELQCP